MKLSKKQFLSLFISISFFILLFFVLPFNQVSADVGCGYVGFSTDPYTGEPTVGENGESIISQGEVWIDPPGMYAYCNHPFAQGNCIWACDQSTAPTVAQCYTPDASILCWPQYTVPPPPSVCGGEGNACCAGNTCNTSDLTCSSNLPQGGGQCFPTTIGSGGDCSGNTNGCEDGYFCDPYQGYTCQYGGQAGECGINAKNGPAGTVYPYNTTSYPTYYGGVADFCQNGNSNPTYSSIQFPNQGGTVNWSCLPTNDSLNFYSPTSCFSQRDPAPTITGSLTPATTACIIPVGSGSCTISYSWVTNNPQGVSSVTSNTNNSGASSPNFSIATGNNGTSVPFTIPYGGRSFYLFNNGVQLALSAVASGSVTCAPGSVWNGITCASTTMTGTLTPATTSCVIPSGASSCNINYSWATTNPQGISSITKPTNVTVATGNSGNNTPLAVKYGGETFYLYNNNVLLAQSTISNASITCISGTAWNGTTCSVPANVPPTSNAGSDSSITLPTSSTSVTGTASDPDGSVSSTVWSKVAGPSTFSISTPNSLTTNITGLITAGTYTFRLTVTDNQGATTTDDMNVVVTEGVPTVEISTTLTSTPPFIYSGDSFTLEWSSTATSCVGSSNPSGSDFTSGAASGSVVLTPITTTTYTVTCGGVPSSPLTITVKKRPNIIEN